MSDPSPFGSGATALVTGASSGFGEAIAVHLAARGVRIIATARHRERLDKLAAKIGRDFHALSLDVTDPAAADGIMDRLPPNWREIDILVNNAGSDVGGRQRFDVGAAGDWASTIETNVTGLLRVTRAVLPGMIARGRGHIVNIGSIAAIRPMAGLAAYGASKAAVHAFSDALRMELKGTPVRVTEILPGTARTGFAAARWRGDEKQAEAFYAGFKSLLTAEDVARTVIFALEQPPHVVIAELVVLPTSQA
ncbi:MAG TPA: SDR family NAD(P)-dependent oxidoreductase [Alphaproteobacteria bacterium]|nr:SDR family NAD(P)-dependent oxidoreductase [Alphaproteobacteria bacterium]